MSAFRTLARRVIPRGVRNWLRSPRDSIAHLWDLLRYAVGSRPVLELHPGWRVVCHPAVIRQGYRAYRDDPAQARELDGFIRAARPGMVLLDLGAHYGAFSLAALRFGGPRALAVAVEPSPVAVRMLRRQAALNGLADRLTIVQAAAAEHSGEIGMVAAGVMGAGYYVPATPDHPPGELSRVDTVSVDGLCTRLSLMPTHLKLDVEGGEAAVLRGATRVLRSPAPPLLFLELHVELLTRRGEDARDPLALLTDAGYELLDWDGTPRSLNDILSHRLVRLMAHPRDRDGRAP